MENKPQISSKFCFTVTKRDVVLGAAFFQGIGCWMCPYEIERIWRPEADRNLTEHIKNKWKECEISSCRHDVLSWFSSLDLGNRERVIEWYNDKVS